MPKKLEETYAVNYDKVNDVMRVYHEVAPTCITQGAAWKKISEHPAGRFYIEPKTAYKRIYAYLRGDFEAINGMANKRKREMYLALVEVVKELMNEKRFLGKTLYYIMPYAVERPAPKFFMSPKGIRNLFDIGKYGKLDKNGKILR